MDDSQQRSSVGLDQQYYLAKLLLEKYDTFHPFFETQMQYYTVACCNISLGGEVKLDVGTKTITYDIKTEKRYKKVKNKVATTKSSKISTAAYKKEIKVAKINLKEWTQRLLWGNGTTVRIYIDGQECT